MASNHGLVLYTLDDPSGLLPVQAEVHMMPDALGLTLCDGATGRCCLRWPWSAVMQINNDISTHEDEMDQVIVTVSSGGFSFECNDGAAVVRDLKEAWRRTDAKVSAAAVAQSASALLPAAAPRLAPRQQQAPPKSPGGQQKQQQQQQQQQQQAPPRSPGDNKKRPRGTSKMVVDWDFVLLIPVAEADGDKKAAARKFTADRFTKIMLGLRTEAISGRAAMKDIAPKEFIDTTQRILRTNRCFLEKDGRSQCKTASGKTLDAIDTLVEEEMNVRAADALRAEKIAAMKAYMRREYQTVTGSLQPCTPAQWSQLVAKATVRRLLQGCGLSCMMKYSQDGDEIIVCIAADERDLEVAADRTNYPLQTVNDPFAPERAPFLPRIAIERPEVLQQARELLRERADDDPSAPMMDPGMFKRHWQEGIERELAKKGHAKEAGFSEGQAYFAPYADFQSDEGLEHFKLFFRHFRNRTGELSPFRQVDRIRLVWQIMARHLNMAGLKHKGFVADCFPLHEKERLAAFRADWALNWGLHPFWGGKKQPLLAVRDYFGEKLALYFAWLEHYTESLIFPAVLGLVVQWLPSNGAVLISFGCLVSVWASLMTEKWKRKNAVLNCQWGMTNFENAEAERPEFVGELRYSPVTDQPEVYYAKGSATRRRIVLGFTTCVVLMAAAGLATWGCLRAKSLFSKPEFGMHEWGLKMAGLLNALQIGVGNMLYGTVAMRLTDWENHRTQSDWERLLVTKTFLFRFINSYFSFFYIAFAKRITEEAELRECTPKPGEATCYMGCGTRFQPIGCMDELSSQILVIFVSQTVFGNITEMAMPMFSRHYKLWQEARAARKLHGDTADKVVLEQPEDEAKYGEYRIEKESFDDYAEMVVQYGFVTLFVVAFPLTPVLALANNVLELHVDSIKLCFGFRRPFPFAGQNIGQWELFMNMISSISVVTNIAIIIFTTDLFATWPEWQKWALFVVAEHALLLVKIGVQMTVEDCPQWVLDLLDRHELLVNKIFKGLEQEEEDDGDEEAEELVLDIHPNAATFTSQVFFAEPHKRPGVIVLERAGYTPRDAASFASSLQEGVERNRLMV